MNYTSVVTTTPTAGRHGGAPTGRGRSGIQAAYAVGFGDPADRDDLGGGPQGHVALGRDLDDLVVRAMHDPGQLVVDFRLVPEVRLQVLHPFEVGDGDPAGVREHIR